MIMVYTIQEIRSKVLPILVKYRIPAMYLFGSYARGDATEDSDIDFLIDTTGTELTSLLRLGALYCDLEEAFQKPIDLITVRSIMQESSMESDIDFRNTVLKERVRLDDVA
jgi:predicted nucleotidyltransferase